MCIRDRLSLLVDVGASVTIIKTKCLNLETQVLLEESSIIKGITSSKTIQTIGSAILKFMFDGRQINHKAQLVQSNTTIPVDGLLGNDFLSKHCKLLNFCKQELILNGSKKALPFFFSYEFEK